MGEAKRRRARGGDKRALGHRRERGVAAEEIGHLLGFAASIAGGYAAPERTYEKELQPDKGEFGGHCNRRACQAPLAGDRSNWWNRGTRKFYCANCAHDLNWHNPPEECRTFLTPDQLEYGDQLCVEVLNRSQAV